MSNPDPVISVFVCRALTEKIVFGSELQAKSDESSEPAIQEPVRPSRFVPDNAYIHNAVLHPLMAEARLLGASEEVLDLIHNFILP